MSLKLSRFSSLSTLLLFSLVACGGGGDDDGSSGDDGGDGDSAKCVEADQHDDLDWIQDNVFTVSCSLSASCHAGSANLARNLNLEPGMSEGNLVSQPSMGEFSGGLNLVEPGQPDQSYLMVVLGQFGSDDDRLPEDSDGNKITMPDSSSGYDLLCEQKRGAIERWIGTL